MSLQVETILISGAISILVAILSVVTTFSFQREQLKQNDKKFKQKQEHAERTLKHEVEQFREEQIKWIIGLQTAYELEKYKIRIASYPQAFLIIGKLSHKARESMTAEKATQVAHELNDWYYSTGGMCADLSTRGAIRLLRKACLTWGKQGSRPPDFYIWRNNALLLLRNDLGIQGLELKTSEIEDVTTLLERAKKEVALATKDEVAQETMEETAK